MNRTKHSKMKAGALIAVTAALMIISSFSLSAFAQSTMDSKRNVVLTETQPPKSLDDGQKTNANTQQDTAGSLTVTPVGMTQEQAERFVQAAEEEFKASSKAPLPQAGYRIKGEYDSNTGEVFVTWLPNSYNDLEPLGTHSEKVYFAVFKQADLNKGSGEIMIGEINAEPGVMKLVPSNNWK